MRLMRLMCLRWMSLLVLVGLTGAFVAALATSAGAAPFETAYTLNSQIDGVTYTGGSVTLDPVVSGGPDPFLNALSVNFTCLDGVCDSNIQDWVLFEVSVLSGDVGQISLSLLDAFAPLGGARDALGLGYLNAGGPVQDGTGGTNLYTGSIADVEIPIFNFNANGGGAGITGTSLVLFAAYADGSLPHEPINFGVFGTGAVSFAVQPFGGAGSASGQGNFASPITIIPEPTTALLFGLGLAMLGVNGRRTRE